ncbi:hypothetical protein [Streptomyces sp. A30]|uniref:hypothetical protein n=1 Tax=Streptomyces sp. A30 TaxID=2789273 RepID=UPI00397E9801
MTYRKERAPPTARIAEFPCDGRGTGPLVDGHILEVLHGLLPDTQDGTKPRSARLRGFTR